MNSPRIRRTVSLVASVLVTFGVVEHIASYAIPADSPQLLVQAETATATPTPAPRPWLGLGPDRHGA